MMKRKRRLIATYITRRMYPALVADMKEAGVWCSLSQDGLQWYVGRFKITNTALMEVYGLTQSQYARFRAYILSENPWGEDIGINT